jgi:hypothetical protein
MRSHAILQAEARTCLLQGIDDRRDDDSDLSGAAGYPKKGTVRTMIIR